MIGDSPLTVRLSSCLRSSNRSVRKSFPFFCRRSNATKHGSPCLNSRSLNWHRPSLSNRRFRHPSPRCGASAHNQLAKLVPRTMRRDARYARREYTYRTPQLLALGRRRISTRRSIQNDRRVPLFGPRASAGRMACTSSLTKVSRRDVSCVRH
jgi:hypothetical protein